MNKVASKSSCPDCMPNRLRAMHYQQETVTDASTPCYTLNGFGSVYYTPCRVSWFSLEFLYSRIRTYTHRCTAGVCLFVAPLMVLGLVMVLRVSILIGDWIGYSLYIVCMIIYILIILMIIIHKVIKLILLNEHSFNPYRFRNY